MNFLNDYKFTLSSALLSLFMSIVSGGWDFLVFSAVMYYIAYMEFEKEMKNVN